MQNSSKFTEMSEMFLKNLKQDPYMGCSYLFFVLV